MERNNQFNFFDGAASKPPPYLPTSLYSNEGQDLLQMFNQGMMGLDDQSPQSHRQSGGSGWSKSSSVDSQSPKTPSLGFSHFEFPQTFGTDVNQTQSFGAVAQCALPNHSPYEPELRTVYHPQPSYYHHQRVPLSRMGEMRHQPKYKYDFCVFCKNNGEDEHYYLTHTLKDELGRVTCPVLHKYTCPYCGATGDVAHTVRYCPRVRDGSLQVEVASITELKQLRSSVGAIGAPRRGHPGIIGSPSRNSIPPSMRQYRGPNAAWTGPTSQPLPLPSSVYYAGDLVDRLEQEDQYSSNLYGYTK